MKCGASTSSATSKSGTRYPLTLVVKNRFPPTSRQTQPWPQQERDARHQRTEAARHYEKKKVFHAVVPAILFL